MPREPVLEVRNNSPSRLFVGAYRSSRKCAIHAQSAITPDKIGEKVGEALVIESKKVIPKLAKEWPNLPYGLSHVRRTCLVAK
jgi:hypothetical protein